VAGYKIADPKVHRDLLFLERAFQKLLLNFTWWVNRKDVEGRHVFGGGFPRTRQHRGVRPLPIASRRRPAQPGRRHRVDGLVLPGDAGPWRSNSLEKPAYEDIASKFFEHFVNICDAINALGGTGLWDSEDGFLLRPAHHRPRGPDPAAHPLARRAAADVRGHRAQTNHHRRAAGFPETHGLVPGQPARGGGIAKRYDDCPSWQNLVLFHEYFHAETGEGLGASHQTGWTSLVVRLVRERAEKLTDHHRVRGSGRR
jgi:hypothetical protein